ncbi:hypothetical protein [Halobacillus halophilus]|uniref:hypothetical protein n=1 Tax=Halobacillus halophilus TaxID=1570 RepID=UPI001CD53E46|nr:hypothetical protein [Halobacillus halophilus]MCA1012227.1 hypothetical protein [Halobacillus halophilus]
MDEDMEKKMDKEDSIVGAAALFLVFAMAIGGVPSKYTGFSLFVLLLLQFVWDIWEVNRRKQQVYKRTFKTLLYVSIIIGVASAIYPFFR